MDKRQVSELFHDLDLDGDGVLTLEEFHLALQAQGIPHSTTTLHQFFDRCDQDGDGTIAKSEFMSFVLSFQSRLDRTFRTWDVEGTGKISVRNIRAAADRIGIHLSHAEATQLVQKMDMNEDGYLSKEEFARALLLTGEAHPQGVFEHWVNHVGIDDGDVVELPEAEDDPHWVLFAAGATAGSLSRTCTAPADRIRTLLQANNNLTLRSAVSQVWKQAGLSGFWRGNFVNCLKIAPEWALKFWAFETAKGVLAQDPTSVSALERFMAGATAGVIATSAIFPMEILKTRMALSSASEYANPVHLILSTAKREGIRGFYRGLLPSLLGIVPYSGTELMTYSMLKDLYAKQFPRQEPGTPTLLACGATASIAGQIVSYPLQLVRTRLMAQGMKGSAHQYTGMVDCFRKTFAADGFLGLYRGMFAGFLKSVPSCMIGFAAYDNSKRVFRRRAKKWANER